MHPASLARLLAAVLLVLSPGLLSPVRAVVPSEAGDGFERRGATTRVLAISVDGLNTTAIRSLGQARLPHLHRLLREGAATLNARTARELTLTLPNHTSMLTGRRIARARGGHGVTWNVDRRRTTVHRAAGRRVESVFSETERAGRSAALFTGKSKFGLFKRSWPAGVDRYRLDERPGPLVGAAIDDLLRRKRAFTFLHLALPDSVGHDHGFMSERYLAAVVRTDRLLGRVLAAIDQHDLVAGGLTVILTADHGGKGPNHSDPSRLANYRVPFLVWGAGVTPGDLYALNPQRTNPGRARTTYGREDQPVRNGDLANLATRLLGLGKVPGSEFGVGNGLRISGSGAARAASATG